jgi:hypothetical protein
MFHKLLFVIIFSVPCFAQDAKQESEIEFSLWTRGNKISPWIFYTGEKFTAEVRHNLDAEGTITACIGKSFGNKSFSLNPEICGYTRKYHGYGPELWILSDTGKFSLTSYLQYARFSDTGSYGFAWFDAEYKIRNQEKKLFKMFGLGIGGLSLKYGKDPVELDLGPSVKIKVWKLYVNAVPTWRINGPHRGNPTPVFGIGVIF